MHNKCSSYGCRNGYHGYSNEGIILHSFPRDPELREQWIRANLREDFKPSKNFKLCSLHFRECDFVIEHHDSNNRRKHSGSKLAKSYLVKNAVPSIFPNAPSYLTSIPSTPEFSQKQHQDWVVVSLKQKD
mgnify:FL=1